MNANIEIYLTLDAPFFSRLPLQNCLDYLQQRIEKHPQLVGEYKSLVMRINYLKARSDGELIKVQASETDRIERLHLQHMTRELVSNKIGEMYCKDCATEHTAENIITESYQRESSSGKRFYCNQNHLIFATIDTKHSKQGSDEKPD